MKKSLLRPLALSLLVSVTASVTLSGCIPLLVGGAIATGAVVVTDRRTTSAQLADKEIYVRANNRLSDSKLGDLSYIAVSSYNQTLYLVGQVPSEAVRRQAISIAKGLPNVVRVVDQLTVEPPIGFSVRTNDRWLSSKIQSTLLTASGVPYRTINILTVDSVVYMLGIVTPQEAQLAAQAAAGVSGVKQVIMAFEYITQNEKETGKMPNPIDPAVKNPTAVPIKDMSTPLQ